jgi:hypothetical protein
MADQQTPEISEADVESLAGKLEQFNQTLTPGEQAALAEVIRHAMPEDEDVQGFSVRSAHGAKSAHGVRLVYSPPLIKSILGLRGVR